ncbi:hypothetical protein [Streptococcus plurextorum]|uniref:hypothetical protein n=1 Tax=Streptococcus plurextorum TaxID=456876 RepID=UPI00040FBAC7|nr:hypothetical protein [Streptococcus plurextorum]
MKRVYHIVFVIFFILACYNLSRIVKDYDELSIPNARSSLVVENWDKNQSAEAIYDQIDEYAQNHKTTLYKVVFSTDDKGELIKNVYPLGVGSKTSTNSLENYSPLGVYYFNADRPEGLDNFMNQLGLTVIVEDNLIHKLYISVILSAIGATTLILLAGLFILEILKILSVSKEMGVRELHGLNKYHRFFSDILKEVLLVTVTVAFFTLIYSPAFLHYIFSVISIYLLLITWRIVCICVMGRWTTLTEKIKSKKPYNRIIVINILLKPILMGVFLFFTVGSINSISRLENLKHGLREWKSVGEYSVLHFSNSTTLLPTIELSKDESLKRRSKSNHIILDMIKSASPTEDLLVSPQQLYSLQGKDILVVTKNYFSYISVKYRDGTEIKADGIKGFKLFIPEDLKLQSDTIEQEAREIIAMNQDITGRDIPIFEGDLSKDYVMAGQNLFSFNVDDIEKSRIKSPVILVLDIEQLGSQIDNLVGEVSQGHYLFKRPNLVSQYINQNNLSAEFAGITSIQSLGLEKIKNIERELQLQIISLVSILLVYVVMYYAILMSYIEQKKKRLVIEYIYGKSWWERQGVFLVQMGLLSILALSISSHFLQLNWYLMLLVLVLEVILINIALLSFETRSRLQILKQGE